MEGKEQIPKRVIITDNLSKEGVNKLQEFAEVDIALGLSKEELKDRIPNYDAIVIRSGTKVTQEIVEAG
ncbi:MAG: phosphoglycerate dehydrogenase, partial [Methanomicrobia archaeon]|nr:phosphoglycerate dehydrogenase [Methanomicrobia archaeon]